MKQLLKTNKPYVSLIRLITMQISCHNNFRIYFSTCLELNLISCLMRCKDSLRCLNSNAMGDMFVNLQNKKIFLLSELNYGIMNNTSLDL